MCRWVAMAKPKKHTTIWRPLNPVVVKVPAGIACIHKKYPFAKKKHLCAGCAGGVQGSVQGSKSRNPLIPLPLLLLCKVCRGITTRARTFRDGGVALKFVMRTRPRGKALHTLHKRGFPNEKCVLTPAQTPAQTPAHPAQLRANRARVRRVCCMDGRRAVMRPALPMTGTIR